HRLQSDAAELGRLGARPALVDRRQRQQPSRLSGVHRALRQPAQLPRRVIPPKPNCRSHDKPPLVCHGESHPTRLGNPFRESLLRGLGITPNCRKISYIAIVAILVAFLPNSAILRAEKDVAGRAKAERRMCYRSEQDESTEPS